MPPPDALRLALAHAPPPATEPAADPEVEAARILGICNACRYCEGFCPVFPAMTLRLAFPAVDVRYLANLCHNCGSCLHACQYAPPHAFAVNVPQTLARLRLRTYVESTWPRPLGALYARNGLALALVLAASLMLFFALARHGPLWQAVPGADFYAVFPHRLLVGVFGAACLSVLAVLALASWRFWRTIDMPALDLPAVRDAAMAVATMRYLDGGHGEGCNERDDRFTLLRRTGHHLLFYGFGLCFLSTLAATFYHYGLGREAPYAYGSAAPLLGFAGGALMLPGALLLLWLNFRRHPEHGERRQRPMDAGFSALLLLTAASGIALAVWRADPAMPLMLVIHLGAVLALFLTLPYGKFLHAPLRAVALLKWAVEKRRL